MSFCTPLLQCINWMMMYVLLGFAQPGVTLGSFHPDYYINNYILWAFFTCFLDKIHVSLSLMTSLPSQAALIINIISASREEEVE